MTQSWATRGNAPTPKIPAFIPTHTFTPEAVNHPAHYNAGKFEVIDVLDDWGLDFCLGNAVKYIARSSHKGKELEDLKKAVWYLNRKISKLEGAVKNG